MLPRNEENTFFYLMHLRRILLQSVIIIGLLFGGLFIFSKPIYQTIALPLLSRLSEGNSLIATTLTAPILVPIKLSFYGALFIATPIILGLLWRFVAPALYQQEKKWIWLSLIGTLLLFYSGILFCYFVILPIVFHFLINFTPDYIRLMPDMGHFLSFTLKLLFAFGLVFETPLVVLVLAGLDIVTLEKMSRLRPYIIVAAFIIGMLLTPPDVISQILLAIPLWLLYELGMLLARLVNVRKTSTT